MSDTAVKKPGWWKRQPAWLKIVLIFALFWFFIGGRAYDDYKRRADAKTNAASVPSGVSARPGIVGQWKCERANAPAHTMALHLKSDGYFTDLTEDPTAMERQSSAYGRYAIQDLALELVYENFATPVRATWYVATPSGKSIESNSSLSVAMVNAASGVQFLCHRTS